MIKAGVADPEERFPVEVLDYENVRLELNGAVAILVLADPDHLNALSLEMVDGIQAALAEVAKPRRGVRALMITGEGRAFCAGANMLGRKADANGGRPSAA